MFQNRPLTPPRYLKQDEYCKDLGSQVVSKYSKLSKLKKEQAFLERLEQVQLAEDLALQREQYLREKKESSDAYRKALDSQILIRKTGNCSLRASPELLRLPKPQIIVPFSHTLELRLQRKPGGRMVRCKPLPIPAQDLETLHSGILSHTSTQNFLANNGIRWKFIAERAPWWGGFYERLIGMTKRCLKKTIGKASLNMIELNTILIEVEAALNSRPLTYSYMGLNDSPPLTPAHFLCGHRLMTLPDHTPKDPQEDPDFDPFASSEKELVKRAKYYEAIMRMFWKRWRNEYLTGLREQDRKRNTNHQTPVSRGDVVLIHDDLPRSNWRMGIVTNLHQGRDGQVRSVNVKIHPGKELTRPIEKLYPLEIKTNDHDEDNRQTQELGTEEEKMRPPSRLAARKAALKITETYNEQ